MQVSWPGLVPRVRVFFGGGGGPLRSVSLLPGIRSMFPFLPFFSNFAQSRQTPSKWRDHRTDRGLSGGVLSDGGHCPITGGVGLTEPIGSPKAGSRQQQVWLRGDRSCSLSVEVASVEAVATTGGGEEVSPRGAAHFPLHAAGRSGWACAGATVEDAYVRVARAKAA